LGCAAIGKAHEESERDRHDDKEQKGTLIAEYLGKIFESKV
jgi:hypothetical protein